MSDDIFDRFSDEELSIIFPLRTITKDALKNLAIHKPITKKQAVVLIRSYYLMQDNRIRLSNQISSFKKKFPDENLETLTYLYNQAQALENEVLKIITVFYRKQPMRWFFEQTIGVGPVLSAGLMAHIDIEEAKYAGSIWRFAGLINDPWEKGQKRPWNADLKTICWKISDSFVKFVDNPNGFYGKEYKARKEIYWERNINGVYVERIKNEIIPKRNVEDLKTGKSFYMGLVDPNKMKAELIRMENRKNEIKIEKAKDKAAGKKVQVYEPVAMNLDDVLADLDKNKKPINGLPMLPPGHIDAMAKRATVKIFLAHLHKLWREYEGLPAAEPYILAHEPKKHTRFIAPPQVAPAPKKKKI